MLENIKTIENRPLWEKGKNQIGKPNYEKLIKKSCEINNGKKWASSTAKVKSISVENWARDMPIPAICYSAYTESKKYNSRL
ncbi:MAG TPA: hypothetical protein PK299_07645 [Anaerolineales bacterium]|nr:hypothetical protein [Anaerolineales bacterium]